MGMQERKHFCAIYLRKLLIDVHGICYAAETCGFDQSDFELILPDQYSRERIQPGDLVCFQKETNKLTNRQNHCQWPAIKSGIYRSTPFKLDVITDTIKLYSLIVV